MAINPISSIIDGGGLDDEELLRYRLQHMMRQRDGQRQPQNIQHWTQGAAHVIDQVGQGLEQQMLMRALQERAAKSTQAKENLWGKLLGGGQPQGSAGGPAPVGGQTVPYSEASKPSSLTTASIPPPSQMSSPSMFPAPTGMADAAGATPVESGEFGMPSGPDFQPSQAPPIPQYRPVGPETTAPPPQLQSGPTPATIQQNPNTRGRIGASMDRGFVPPEDRGNPQLQSGPQLASRPMSAPPPQPSSRSGPPPAPQMTDDGDIIDPSEPMQGEVLPPVGPPPPLPERNNWTRMQAKMEIPTERVNDPRGTPITQPQGVVAHDTSGRNPFGLGPRGSAMYNITVPPDGRIIAPRGVHQTDMGPAFGVAPHAVDYNKDSIGVARVGTEGQPLTPQAQDSLGLVNRALAQRYGLSNEQFATHPALVAKTPETGRRATKMGGKDPQEANWLPATLPGRGPTQPPMAQYAQLSDATGGTGRITSDMMRQYLKDGGKFSDIEPLLFKELQRRNGMLNQYGKAGQIFKGPDGQYYSVQFGGNGERLIQPLGPGLTPSKGTQKVDTGTGTEIIDSATGQSVRQIEKDLRGAETEKKIGQAAGERSANQSKVVGAMQSAGQRLDFLDDQINKALGSIDGSTTGMLGSVTQRIPGTKGYDLSQRLQAIKANIGFDKLDEMRRNSPTGGALGQVTERELAFLQAVWGSIEQSQSGQQLTESLNRLRTQMKQSYQNIKDAYERDYGPITAQPQATQQGQSNGLAPGRYRYNPQTGQLEPAN